MNCQHDILLPDSTIEIFATYWKRCTVCKKETFTIGKHDKHEFSMEELNDPRRLRMALYLVHDYGYGQVTPGTLGSIFAACITYLDTHEPENYMRTL